MSTFGDALRQRVRFEAARIAGQARGDLEQSLKTAAPVGTPNPWQTHEPGQLRDSIAVNVRFDQTVFTFTAACTVDYASFTDQGTGPHPIVALSSPRKVLRFDFPRAGLSPAFFPHVQHPGSQGTQWWSKTLDTWPQILEGALQ